MIAIVGVDLGDGVVAGNLMPQCDPISYQEAISLVLTESPELAAARAKLAADQVTVRREQVEWVPDIVAAGAAGYSEQPPSDIEIVRETQEAIRRSPYLERRDVRVHCQRAHVSLYGIVESETEKQVAGWLASGVTGVVHVNNSLAVEKKWKEKSDEKIKEALERKLKYALFDTSNQIDVTVENGVAILRGEVDTWRQWQAVLDLTLEAGATLTADENAESSPASARYFSSRFAPNEKATAFNPCLVHSGRFSCK